jgi:hypothetical protein
MWAVGQAIDFAGEGHRYARGNPGYRGVHSIVNPVLAGAQLNLTVDGRGMDCPGNIRCPPVFAGQKQAFPLRHPRLESALVRAFDAPIPG